jgi:hypothetical protein
MKKARSEGVSEGPLFQEVMDVFNALDLFCIKEFKSLFDPQLNCLLVAALQTYAGAVAGELLVTTRIDDETLELLKNTAADNFDSGVILAKAKCGSISQVMRDEDGSTVQ